MPQTCVLLLSFRAPKTTVHIYLHLCLTTFPKAVVVQVFVASIRHLDKKWIAVLSRPSKQASCLWRYRWVWYRMLFNPETTPWPPGRPIPHTAHPSCGAIEWMGYRASPREGEERKERGDVEGVRGEEGVTFHPCMWVEVTIGPPTIFLHLRCSIFNGLFCQAPSCSDC